MPEIEKNIENEEIVELNLAEMHPLTPYNEEFFIPKVEEGQDIRVGWGASHGQLFIRSDFSFFEKQFERISPERFEELFNQVGKLETQQPKLDENQRKLFYSCFLVTRTAKRLLGEISPDPFIRNQSFDEYAAKTFDGKKVCIKPLSECKGQAFCAEYALIVQHLLKKLGIQSSIIIGAFLENPDDLGKTFADAHTYLVLENGKYVFDPTHTAQQQEIWPPKIFLPEVPFTEESLKDMNTDPNKPFGEKFVCTDILTKEKRIYGTGAA